MYCLITGSKSPTIWGLIGAPDFSTLSYVQFSIVIELTAPPVSAHELCTGIPGFLRSFSAAVGKHEMGVPHIAKTYEHAVSRDVK